MNSQKARASSWTPTHLPFARNRIAHRARGQNGCQVRVWQPSVPAAVTVIRLYS